MVRTIYSLLLCLFASLTAVAAGLDEVVNLYLVGSSLSTGWNRDTAPQMTNAAPGIYTWVGQLNPGELKFLTSRSKWDSLVAETPDRPVTLYSPMGVTYNAEGGSHDYKWIVGIAGRYGLVLNTNNATLTVSDYSTDEATVCQGVKAAESSYKICQELRVGRFIVTATDGTVTRYLLETGNGSYIYVADPALATVYRMTRNPEYVQTLINTSEMSIERKSYEPWENLYITGSFNGWSFNKMTPVDGSTVFKWEGNINGFKSEVKFIGADTFDPVYNDLHLHPYSAGQTLEGFTHAVVGGVDNKWTTAKAGRFSITVDPFRLTVDAANLSGIDSTPADSAATIETSPGRLLVSIPGGDPAISVYTPSGRLIAHADGTLDISLPSGIYIVKAAGQAYKIAL